MHRDGRDALRGHFELCWSGCWEVRFRGPEHLYVTAAQAYEIWKAAPDKVKVIDVRTPEEYAFVGHPEMDYRRRSRSC